jgi:hypothetical protein
MKGLSSEDLKLKREEEEGEGGRKEGGELYMYSGCQVT